MRKRAIYFTVQCLAILAAAQNGACYCLSRPAAFIASQISRRRSLNSRRAASGRAEIMISQGICSESFISCAMARIRRFTSARTTAPPTRLLATTPKRENCNVFGAQAITQDGRFMVLPWAYTASKSRCRQILSQRFTIILKRQQSGASDPSNGEILILCGRHEKTFSLKSHVHADAGVFWADRFVSCRIYMRLAIPVKQYMPHLLTIMACKAEMP